jgi:hypothetical protein
MIDFYALLNCENKENFNQFNSVMDNLKPTISDIPYHICL